jgi:hypothetical protein
MSETHRLTLSVTLVPTGEPEVRVQLGLHCYQQRITNTAKFEFDVCVSEPQVLEIELVNKSDVDPHTAVNIDCVEIFGIQDPRFVWAGQYRPSYPEPWASEQRAQGHDLPEVLTNHTCLGWRGVWTLELPVPVFTWMHTVQSLGTVYK